MPTPRPRFARDGGRLRSRLFVILTVPLIATAYFSLVRARTEGERIQSAQAVHELVNDVSAVDVLRRAFEAEIEPTSATGLLRQTAILAELHASAADLNVLHQVAAALPAAKQATDEAFARALARTSYLPAKQQLQTLRAQLDAARQNDMNVARVIDHYTAWSSLVDGMGAVESALFTRAGQVSVSNHLAASISAFHLVSDAAALASTVIPRLILAASTTTPDARIAAQQQLLAAWGGYLHASAQVAAEVAEPIRTSWIQATSSELSRQTDSQLAAASADPSKVGLRTVSSLEELVSKRQESLNSVVAASLGRTITAADAVRDNAHKQVLIITIFGLLLLLLTFALAVLGDRWMGRALVKLADQAQRVSEGELPRVDIAGPREIRTVARALAAAVGTLRRIQDQAAAVAAGELDSEVLSKPLPGPLGRVVHASVDRIVEAIHERESAQLDLAHRAAHDALTELPNRAEAVRVISRSLHRAQRTGDLTGLMFLDLDHFKVVNDTFGHAAGDCVLQEVSRRMTSVVREGDLVARLGGDEFVILLENLTSDGDFVQLANRLVEIVAEPIEWDQRQLHIGASIGVALCRDSHVDGDRLMREADAAVYRAKSAGRGQVVIFDDQLREQLEKRSYLEDCIVAALANDEFLLYYQPVIDLQTGSVTGFEALIRWNRPGFGLVSPDEFIPVAEGSKLINDIGRFVLREGTRQLAEWTAADPATAELTMAVNVSGRHLSSDELIDDVRRCLAESGIEAQRLVVELTETVLVDDPRAARNMTALRDLGVKVAIDDFGSGYTSIGQLPRLPIDTLKIDRSFISSPDPSHATLVQLMVAAAEAFGLSIVAEGVETAGQAETLRLMNVGSCQGFYFSAPQPAELINPVQLMRGHLHDVA